MRLTLPNASKQFAFTALLTRISSSSRVLAAFASAAVACLLTAPTARAQSAHFGGVQTVSSVSFASYGGVVVDGAGDVFLADDQNRQIVEFSASKTTALEVGGGEPEYMALDASNNLYVATTTPSQVVKLTFSKGLYSAPQVIDSECQAPWGIAVDSYGNVFVADHATSVVYKLAPLGGALYAQSTFLRAGILNGPVQMAIDNKNNLYIADRGNNRVVLVSPAGWPTYPFATVTAPDGVAVDAKGNVAITGSGGLIYEQPTKSGYTATLAASNFLTPYGVAFDTGGNMYVNDDHARQLIVQTPMTASASFGTVDVGNDSTALGLVFVSDSSSALGSPAVSVTGDSEFWMTNQTTCTANETFAGGGTCTVNMVFTPTTGGYKNATLELLGASGEALISLGVNGSGYGGGAISSGGECAMKGVQVRSIHPNCTIY